MQKTQILNLAFTELELPFASIDRAELTHIVFDILTYPNLHQAQQHCKANKIGNYDLKDQQHRLCQQLKNNTLSDVKICDCCGKIVNRQNISFLTDMDEVKLGIGVRLYFMTLLFNLTIFLVGFIFYSLCEVIQNMSISQRQIKNIEQLCANQSQCKTAQLGMGAKLILNKVYHNQILIQCILGIGFIIIWSMINLYKSYKQRKIEEQFTQHSVSASNFTLMISKVPKQFLQKSQTDLLQSVRQVFLQYQKEMHSQISYDIIKVNIGYPLYNVQEEVEQMKKQNEQELFKRRSAFIDILNEKRNQGRWAINEDARSKLYADYHSFLVQKYNKSQIHKVQLNQENIIFVTLRYSQAKEEIQNLNKPKSYLTRCLSFCNSQTNHVEFPFPDWKIMRSPQPDEVIWQNIGFSTKSKRNRRLLIFIIAALLIGVSLFANFQLSKYQTNTNQYFISIMISLVITMMNFLIQFIIIVLSYYENEFIKSREQASIGVKIGIFQIVNSIGIPIALIYLSDKKIYASGGLVTDVFFIALMNLVIPIGRFIDPYNLLLLLKAWYYCQPHKRIKYIKNQTQFNQLFASYQFQLGYQYSYIVKTSFFTAFFMPLQPIIALFAPIGLGFMYLTNKYRVFYRFHKPKFHSSSVNRIFDFILHFSLLSFSFGQLFFMNFQDYIMHLPLLLNWVSVGIAVFFILFPFRKCHKMYKHSQKQHKFDYFEQQIYLSSDYDRVNPVTKEQAIDQFRVYLNQFEKDFELPQQSKILRLSLQNMKNVSTIERQRVSLLRFPQIMQQLHTAERWRA